MSATSSTEPRLPTPIDCETAIRRLWDYIDGRLPTVLQEEVEEHLATCALCATRFRFARAMKDALGESGAAETLAHLDAGRRRALSARVRDALRRARE